MRDILTLTFALYFTSGSIFALSCPGRLLLPTPHLCSSFQPARQPSPCFLPALQPSVLPDLPEPLTILTLFWLPHPGVEGIQISGAHLPPTLCTYIFLYCQCIVIIRGSGLLAFICPQGGIPE